MPVFGEGKALVELFSRWRQWRVDRRDPARLQAERLITAFEAYGVQRQQIARLMPELLALPSALLSSPVRLKEKMSPALLNWAAEYLALNRAWFDGADPQPHLLIEGYKDTPVHEQWLRSRIAAVQDVGRHIVAWRSDSFPVNFDSAGPLCLAYVEYSDGLDGKEFSRYWMLSRNWPLGHPPSVECLSSLVKVARSLGIMMTGRIKPLSWLARLEQGQAFAPQVHELGGELWHPEDVVFGDAIGRRELGM